MSCSSPAACAAEKGSDGVTRKSRCDGRDSATSGFQPFPFLLSPREEPTLRGGAPCPSPSAQASAPCFTPGGRREEAEAPLRGGPGGRAGQRRGGPLAILRKRGARCVREPGGTASAPCFRVPAGCPVTVRGQLPGPAGTRCSFAGVREHGRVRGGREGRGAGSVPGRRPWEGAGGAGSEPVLHTVPGGSSASGCVSARAGPAQGLHSESHESQSVPHTGP